MTYLVIVITQRNWCRCNVFSCSFLENAQGCLGTGKTEFICSFCHTENTENLPPPRGNSEILKTGDIPGLGWILLQTFSVYIKF